MLGRVDHMQGAQCLEGKPTLMEGIVCWDLYKTKPLSDKRSRV
jgi:hypothetical protein